MTKTTKDVDLGKKPVLELAHMARQAVAAGRLTVGNSEKASEVPLCFVVDELLRRGVAARGRNPIPSEYRLLKSLHQHFSEYLE